MNTGSHFENDLGNRLDRLIEIGTALSTESDLQRLLERILLGAKELTNADGGTLYSVDAKEKSVKMEIIRTESLNFAMGGTSGNSIPFPPIPLYDSTGHPRNDMVVTYAVLNDCTVNIPDAYDAQGFDFSGTRKFDRSTGFHSKSFLTVPMKNHDGDIIGILQLLNAKDETTGQIIPFSPSAQQLTESLASQAAIALTNRELLNDLKKLLESLIQLIATAIDEKSPYTGGHCRRVPEITMMLADAANASNAPAFADFHMDEKGRYELSIAAWLHDCGKITTPEAVVDKATKLQTIYDRIRAVRTRFELLRRDAEIALLKGRLAALEAGQTADEEELQRRYQETLARLAEEEAFLEHHNQGAEFMSPDAQERVREIGRQSWTLRGETKSLLSADEVYNLTIDKGTLTREEREIINHHIVATIKMLESLPFPKHLRNVPEFAGGHHERMDGKGYPRGLTRDKMSVQARIMAIADIFEALTAKDRPYKEGKKLSEAMSILGKMKQGNHIDPDLFKLFVESRIFEKYAKEFLDPAQIDEVELEKIPGYEP